MEHHISKLLHSFPPFKITSIILFIFTTQSLPSFGAFEQSFGTHRPLELNSGFSFQQSLVGPESPKPLSLSQCPYKRSQSHYTPMCPRKHLHTHFLLTLNCPPPKREFEPHVYALFATSEHDLVRERARHFGNEPRNPLGSITKIPCQNCITNLKTPSLPFVVMILLLFALFVSYLLLQVWMQQIRSGTQFTSQHHFCRTLVTTLPSPAFSIMVLNVCTACSAKKRSRSDVSYAIFLYEVLKLHTLK